MTDRPLHIDLFAGAGGFGCGLRAAGFRTVAAVESDAVRCRTLGWNHPCTAVVQADVRMLSGWDLIRLLPRDGRRYRPPDLLTASPPCGPFSPAGSRGRVSADDRVWLAREGVRLAAAVRAQVVLFENVPRFASHRAGSDLVIDVLRRDLDAAGYTNRREVVLDAADHGVPQHRRRWFLLASIDGTLSLKLPRPSCGRPVTVREAFAGLPAETGAVGYAGGSSGYAARLRDHESWGLGAGSGLTHHDAPRSSAARRARYSLVRPGRRVADLLGSLDEGVVAELRVAGVLPRAVFKQSGQRLHPGRPAPTVTATAADRLLHPRESRGITVREAARLQGFPDGCSFAGGTTAQYRQIGDAVPPLLAWRWGESLRLTLGDSSLRSATT